jgi:2-dehydropantoate 2-reductase
MRICVVGPGAMGCLYAGRLALAGQKVVLVDYRPDRAQRLLKEGISIEEGGRTRQVHLNVTASPCPPCDLAIIMTKAYSCPELTLPDHIPVLCLQNGLGTVEALCAKVGSANVIAGTTTEAATLLAPGAIRHVAPGETTIGSWTSCPVEPAAGALRQAGFTVNVTDSPGQAIWEKTALSAGINPLTALLNVANGQLLQIPEARQLMRDLVVEAAKVATTEGYRFDHSLIERAEQVCADTTENISSMLQDVRNKRRTEIDAISGEIMRRAQAGSLPTPRTRVVYQLIKSLERH